jgi:hypothetical protein
VRLGLRRPFLHAGRRRGALHRLPRGSPTRSSSTTANAPLVRSAAHASAVSCRGAGAATGGAGGALATDGGAATVAGTACGAEAHAALAQNNPPRSNPRRNIFIEVLLTVSGGCTHIEDRSWNFLRAP